MARPGITYPAVAEAATALAQAGQNPTVDGVRTWLGTGSKSTIAPLLKQWKAHQKEGIPEAKAGLPRELVAAVKGLYDHLQQQAQAEIAASKETARCEVETARLAQQTAETRHKELEKVLAQRAAALAQLEEEKQALETTLSESQRAQLTLKVRVETLQQQSSNQIQSLQTLQHYLAQTQTNLEHYRESIRQQRVEERSGWERRQRQLEQELQATRTEHQTVRMRYRQLESDHTRLDMERKQMQEENASLKEQMEQLRQELACTRRQLAEGEGRYQILTQVHRQVITKLEARETDKIEWEKTTAVAHEQAAALGAALRKAERTIEQLQKNNRQLVQDKARLAGQLKQWQQSVTQGKQAKGNDKP